ncbi:hypothetical protein D9M68_752510 [compost metagenome]
MLQLHGDGLEQLVGTLAAQALVESAQVVDPQQQHETAAGVLIDAHARLQLQIEVAPVGQPGKAVLIGLGTQLLAARGFLGEQRLELLDHLVHGIDHPPELGSLGQFGQAEKLAPGDGVGLLDHIIQRAQLALEQQHAQADAEYATERQPQQDAERALPEFADGEQRMADHLQPRRLAPAVADDGIAAGGRQIH